VSENNAMRKVLLAVCLLFAGCAAKKQVAPVSPPPAAPAPMRSQMPPPNAQIVQHCVVVKQENANTVTCSCLPVTTKIDSKTGHTAVICKKMKEGR
jgi:uncharacterized lipoprotein YajG